MYFEEAIEKNQRERSDFTEARWNQASKNTMQLHIMINWTHIFKFKSRFVLK